MQQGVERDNRDREHSIGLRVGLSGGEVSGEDDDYFGDPVVEAARLCAICESGQVLAAEIVRLTAGRRSRHDCRPLGELTLKGLPDPVETVEVLWEPLPEPPAGASIPLPSRLAVGPDVGCGRARDRDGVARRTPPSGSPAAKGARCCSSRVRPVWARPPWWPRRPGLRSTTGPACVFGHCEEDLATPYQLFAEALGHYVTHAPEDQLLGHVEQHGSELARLVPVLASRIPDLPPSRATDADSERYLLFAATVGLLAMVSALQPVVLVLDDLQWADKGSLLLLRHLTAAEPSMRVLLLGTYRDNELPSSHPLLDALAALHRQSGVSRIELAGLDDVGVLALMEAAAGYTLDDVAVGLALTVYQETDGNPYFVSEVLRHLSETGAIYQDGAGRWTARDSLDQIALPESVRVVITARSRTTRTGC